MPREKILVVVKTYPAISRKYTEVVCTAGIREDGSWIRIYPIPFRSMEDFRQYKKYQWMEVDTEKSSDPRPESYKVIDIDNIKLLDTIDTGKKRDWAERKNLILDRNTIYTNLDSLIKKAKDNDLSLAIFKPEKIIDLVVKEVEREWDQDKIRELDERAKQGSLFEQVEKDMQQMPKLPYKFSYKFLDDEGKESTLMIEDWEIGQLYWQCFKRNNSEEEAIKKVREKFIDEFISEKDIYLFLGTTRQHHFTAPNPFVIVGVFYPPMIKQIPLL